jgi:hypothetical protein
VLECGNGGTCVPGYSCLDAGNENACLPNGTFPGSACRATQGDECDQDLGGNTAVDMQCVAGTCLVSCPSNNDALCGAVDSALTCSETLGNVCVVECDAGDCPDGYSCLDPGGENACLPDGTFPGSACRATQGDECDQNVGGNENVDMQCLGGACVVECMPNLDILCNMVDSALTCFSTLNVCLPACVGGNCPLVFSSDPSENACVPDG